jgi:uncharacterized repeat protein (TIGR03803 family)
MSLLRQRKLTLTLAFAVLHSVAAWSQAFTTLQIFNGTDGGNPVDVPLIQGLDGNLYGTTLGGGTPGPGTVFRITPQGKLATIYDFCSQTNCVDGSEPYGGLVLGTDGDFYGTTSQGGTNDDGTVFKITAGGNLTTLYSFSTAGAAGGGPMAPMIQARDGNFYGTTQFGGEACNMGAIFKITPNGTLTPLYGLGCSDGSDLTAPLMQASDGNFYSTTELGGAHGYGSIFRITPAGEFSTFYSFSSTDGSAPAGALVQATDGNLYGTTYQGGAFNTCANGCGTVFKISLAGVLSTIANLEPSGPANPIAALIQATDGNFYGTSYAGGSSGDWGTVFEVTPSGNLKVLHSFDGNDGGQPYGPVTQDTNGDLYGTTTNGQGTAAQGTVFRETTELFPFARLTRTSGKIGQTVGILGQSFQSSVDVTFNGKEASFKIESGTFLVATIPSGATSGFVKVTTASGVVESNVPFQVIP